MRYYQAGTTNTSFEAAYNQILTDFSSTPGLTQVSVSYYLGETYEASVVFQTESSLFAMMKNNGITVFACSGDNGSNPNETDGSGGPLQVSYPASDPSVIAVGGTSLILNANGSVQSEVVWNDSDGATGGGQSIQFARPSWQTGYGVPNGSMRLVPDLACAADPAHGAWYVLDGVSSDRGGTSWSAPTMAGFCAMINQGRANNGLASLYQFGQDIYTLLGSANFSDITSGNNGAYSAAAGYDECTVVGRPVVGTLLNTLISGTWHSGALTTNGNMAQGNRTGVAHNVWPQYYYKGTDGNVWAVYYNGTAWVQKALTTTANVSDWLTFQPNYGAIYYQGTNDQIWVVYFDGTQWRQAQQTTNGNIASDIVVDTTWNFFYYRGTDGNVWADYWNGSAWTQKALTTAANVSSVANVGGNLSVDSGLHFIYYRGSDNNMWVCYFDGTKWDTAKLSTTANVGGAVTADANGFVYYKSSVDNTPWAEYFNGTAWAQKQLGTIQAGTGVMLFANYTLIYIDPAGQALTLYFNGATWNTVLFGGGTSGLTNSLGVNPAIDFVFCGRSDGNVYVFNYYHY